MRRTRDSGEKRKKLLVYLIGFIMVSSAFGVIFFGFNSGGTNPLVYDKYKFTYKGGVLSTMVNGKEALFSYLPSDVEPIMVNGDAISRLKNAVEIDLTSDFNDTFAESIALAQFQMDATLSNFNIFLRKGFTNETTSNLQVITCKDSTSFVPVIYFKGANTTSVYLENSCIIAEAVNQADVIRVKDRLIYGMLGIIK